MKKKIRYWFNPTIGYKSFKAVCDKFSDSGIVPQGIDKMLWKMLRERKINMGLRNGDDPIFISLKPIPKNATLLTNPSHSRKAGKIKRVK